MSTLVPGQYSLTIQIQLHYCIQNKLCADSFGIGVPVMFQKRTSSHNALNIYSVVYDQLNVVNE